MPWSVLLPPSISRSLQPDGWWPGVNSDPCGFLQRFWNQQGHMYRTEAFLVLSAGPARWVILAVETVCKTTHLTSVLLTPMCPCQPHRVREGQLPSFQDGFSDLHPAQGGIRPSLMSLLPKQAPCHLNTTSQGDNIQATVSDFTTAWAPYPR